MSVLSRDRNNKELGAIGGKKPMSRQSSSSSRASSVVFMESLMQQQREQMRQQHLEFMERMERASPELNPVELRTNPSDGNFVFHTVPPQVTPSLATRS